MTECDRFRASAAGIASLRPGDPERAAAQAHARGCPACARTLRESERLQELLRRMEPEPLPPGALARASSAILAELRREGRRRAAASALAAAAAFLALFAVARQPAPSPGAWGLGIALLGSAAALAAAAGRIPLLAAGTALLAALAAAALAGGAGPLDPGAGLPCLAAEIAAAGAVLGALWLAVRGGTTSPGRTAAAAAAASGALAGNAALQITCGAQGALAHALAWHAGGVLVAAVLAWLLWRRPNRMAAPA